MSIINCMPHVNPTIEYQITVREGSEPVEAHSILRASNIRIEFPRWNWEIIMNALCFIVDIRECCCVNRMGVAFVSFLIGRPINGYLFKGCKNHCFQCIQEHVDNVRLRNPNQAFPDLKTESIGNAVTSCISAIECVSIMHGAFLKKLDEAKKTAETEKKINKLKLSYPNIVEELEKSKESYQALIPKWL